jgi:hypothetical protein
MQGWSQNRIAREVGCSPGAVNNLAKEKNIKPTHAAPEHANDARRKYSLAERIALSDELFDRIREMIARRDLTPKDIKEISLAYGITTDKRRLEDGESTSRSEQKFSRGFNLEEEFAKLDEKLAAENSENGEAPFSDGASD